ncbi:MAG: hypothetical protein M0C28_30845 [Candidatus Moduliflexus flocculans]|nr:hypothetical protein [Candidatus Moduliflexus flocculans]
MKTNPAMASRPHAGGPPGLRTGLLVPPSGVARRADCQRPVSGPRRLGALA